MKKAIPIIFLSLLGLLSACDEYPVDSLSFDVSRIELAVGESKQIEVILLPLSSAYANTVSWESSDETVAVVDAEGNITAVYSGSCVVTASAGGKTASCVVDVDALEYEFAFSRAQALLYGNIYDAASNNFVLRLMGDGVTMDNDGNLEGEGLFVNIDLQLPQTHLSLASGTFNLSQTREAFTFVPGEIEVIGGIQYATGTFVGQRTSSGLGVVFVQAGSFWITQTGDLYKLEARFLGEKAENILITFEGTIPIIDKTVENPSVVITLTPQSVTSSFLGDIYSEGLNICRQTITHTVDTVLQVELFEPLSVTDAVLIGTYSFSGSRTYSIVPPILTGGLYQGTWLFIDNEKIKIVGGQVIVSQGNGLKMFSCKLIDELDRIIDVNYTIQD